MQQLQKELYSFTDTLGCKKSAEPSSISQLPCFSPLCKSHFPPLHEMPIIISSQGGMKWMVFTENISSVSKVTVAGLNSLSDSLPHTGLSSLNRPQLLIDHSGRAGSHSK